MTTRVIAELCYNHQGNIQIAKEMIDACSELGLFAVKFQKWDIEGFSDSVKNKPRFDDHAFGKTYYEHRKALELTVEQLLELKSYAEHMGLEFVCSGKDYNSIIEIVEKLKCKWVKVPSQRYFSNRIFKYLHRKRSENKFKIIVSTGMCYGNEVLNSKWVTSADVRMHCISLYPAKTEHCDFGFMRKMKFYNGYSSHEQEGKAIKYAVMLGAEYIERHFTLDRLWKGTDQMVSSDVNEMEKIIREIENAEIIMGSGERNLTQRELENRMYYRGF